MKSISRTIIAGLLALGACVGCGGGSVPPPPVDPELQAGMIQWLDENGRPPQEYVIDKFAEHDVVFLGEIHRVQHVVLFVQSLLKPLHEKGIRVLATEFARREDQPLIDSLLAAPVWYEDLAREITFRQHIWWGYQEYIDIFRSAWQLNRSLPADAPPFRILGLNDSPDWSVMKTREDRDNSDLKREVWKGGGEDKWAAVILEAVGAGEAGEKVLAYTGIHHAFTEYRQPMLRQGEFDRFDPNPRCGNHVFNAIGRRAITIFFHAPWRGPEGYGAQMEHPADGIIDAVMLAAGPGPVGFDLGPSPLGGTVVRNTVYHHGYDNFTPATFCDGWIYTMPLSECRGVTPIPGWINESNLEYARAQCPDPRFREAAIRDFERGVARAADLQRKWGHLR